MKSAVIVFPGSNCDRDLKVAIEMVTGRAPDMVWHRDSELPAGTGLVSGATMIFLPRFDPGEVLPLFSRATAMMNSWRWRVFTLSQSRVRLPG